MKIRFSETLPQNDDVQNNEGDDGNEDVENCVKPEYVDVEVPVGGPEHADADVPQVMSSHHLT